MFVTLHWKRQKIKVWLSITRKNMRMILNDILHRDELRCVAGEIVCTALYARGAKCNALRMFKPGDPGNSSWPDKERTTCQCKGEDLTSTIN